MAEKRENLTFRALYLIAICFVVDGHIPLEGELLNFGGLFRYYSFHMLLFAFGSGYFYDASRSFREALIRDVKRLLVPLYLWNLIYGLLTAFFRRFLGTAIGEPLSLFTLLAAPLLDGEQFALNTGAWFLGALFLVRQAYRLISCVCGKRSWAAMILSLAVGSAGVHLTHTGQIQPLFLIRAMILLPGYAFGVFYREHLERMDRLPTVPYLAVIVLLRVIFTTAVPENTYLLSDLTYFPCGPAGVYLGAVLAIAFYLRIARLLGPHLPRCPILLYASRHTFEIMMHHCLGIFLLNLPFLLLNKFGLGAEGFSISAFRTQLNYTYAPNGAPQWAVLYLMAGIFFSCLAARLVENGKEKLWKRKVSGA